MINKSYHVVFHNDIDGIVSAAIYLHNHIKGSSYRLYPLSSSFRGDRFNDMINHIKESDDEKLIILDYQNHQLSDLWIDHHWNETMGNEAIHNEKIHYDPSAKSAARLVNNIQSKEAGYPDSFLRVVDMIDKAEYESVNQIFTDTHPLMIIRAYIEKMMPIEMIYCRIVEMIAKCHFDFKETIYRLKLDESYIEELKKDSAKISKYITIYNNFSVVRQTRSNQYPRYSEYYVRSSLKYAIRISAIGGDRFGIQVGYNKWSNKPNDINIGIALSKLNYLISGGGHYNVGGGVIANENIEKFMDDLDVLFNPEDKEEADMEKYAVDQNDPIELKAEEMVKTGEEKDLNKAREKALESKKGEEDAGTKE